MYDFPVQDCTQEQNGSQYFYSRVQQCKWPSLSRKIVEIQEFYYHGNLTSHFSSLLTGDQSSVLWQVTAGFICTHIKDKLFPRDAITILKPYLGLREPSLKPPTFALSRLQFALGLC